MKINKLLESNKTDDYLSIKDINWLKDNPGQEIKKTHYKVSYNDYVNANTNEPMGGHFTVVENRGRDTTRVDGVQELKDYIVRRYNKYFEESISRVDPTVKFQGKSSHTFTKDKKWEVDFDEAGNIVARTRHGKPYYFKGHINDKVSAFPYSDEDNIILAAREQHGLKFGNKEVKEDYTHFKFTSGANPYIAKDEKEKNRMLKKYGNKAKEIKPGFYKVDDSEKDLFRVEEGWYEDHLDTMQRKTSGYDKCYKIVKKARTSNPIDTNALNDARDHFGYDLYKMCLDDVLKEMDNLDEAFKIGSNDIQNVKVYNQYNYTIQELRIDNREKTFERGNFSMGKPDKKVKNRQEYEDIVDKLKEMGYKEIPSDYHSLRNRSRKGVPTNESKSINENNIKHIYYHNDIGGLKNGQWLDVKEEDGKLYGKWNFKGDDDWSEIKNVEEMPYHNFHGARPAKTFTWGGWRHWLDDEVEKFWDIEGKRVTGDFEIPGMPHVKRKKVDESKSIKTFGAKAKKLDKPLKEGRKKTSDPKQVEKAENAMFDSLMNGSYNTEWMIQEAKMIYGISYDEALSAFRRAHNKFMLANGELEETLKDEVTRYKVEYYTDDNDEDREVEYIYADSLSDCKQEFKKRFPNAIATGFVPEKVPASYKKADMKESIEDDSEWFVGDNETGRMYKGKKAAQKAYDNLIKSGVKDAIMHPATDDSLNEASYGGAFDIEDDQLFTREDIEYASEDVIDHINETFDDRFQLGGTWFENGEWIVNVQTEDGMEEYEEKIKIDLRKIRNPFHDLKNKYALEIAAKLISQIKKDKYGMQESLNESTTEDAQPIETDAAYGVASIINGLIVDEYEAIEGYNTAIVNAQAEGYDDMVKVLTEIQAEENIHVGQLIELMKMVDPNADKITDGMEEGKEQLASEPENESKISIMEKLYKKVIKNQ